MQSDDIPNVTNKNKQFCLGDDFFDFDICSHPKRSQGVVCPLSPASQGGRSVSFGGYAVASDVWNLGPVSTSRRHFTLLRV